MAESFLTQIFSHLSFKRKATLETHVSRIHESDDESACSNGIASENETQSSGGRVSPSFSCESDYLYSGEEETEKPPLYRPKSSLKKRRKRTSDEESDYENNVKRKKVIKTCKSDCSVCSKSGQNKSTGIVYKCAACEKINYCYHEHLKHIVIHDKVDDTLTVETSLEQLKKAPSGFLECKECGGVFMSEREYNIHQKSHQGVHQCEICKTILLTRSGLRKHKNRMHMESSNRKIQLFECNICNDKYESQLLMLQHRRNHTEVMKKIEEMTIIDRSNGKTSYVCKICTKTSNNKFRHEEHLRVHTKEKPYKCEECGVSIATSNALAHHRRSHTNITFECNVCETKFRHKRSLTKHLKLHTGEKPFECRHCDKTFTFNYTRADHERNCHVNSGTSRKQNRKRKFIKIELDKNDEESLNDDQAEENELEEPTGNLVKVDIK